LAAGCWPHNEAVKPSVRILLICLALSLAGAACGPPEALRERIGREGSDNTGGEVSPDEFPAPESPGQPADGRLGALVLTNESSWGLFLSRAEDTPGSLVIEVLPDSPAQSAGLVPGDVITWLDGTDISNHEQLTTILRSGSTDLHILRVAHADGSTDETEIELTPSDSFSVLAYLENKVAADPGPVGRYLLAENLPDRNRGIEMIRALVAEHPQFAEGHVLLARLLIDRINQTTGGGTTLNNHPDLVEATTAIDTAVDLDPGSASVLRARSQILLDLGDVAGAGLDAEEAVSLDHSSAEAHFLLGTSHLILDRPEEAIPHLHRAVELNPFASDYYINLALCYRALNRESDAQATILAARTLADGNQELSRRLDDLMRSSSPQA